MSFSSNGSLLACTVGSSVELWDVEARTQISQIEFNTYYIQRLVLSPDLSQLAALTPSGLKFFDLINKRNIYPRHNEYSWVFQSGILISQPDGNNHHGSRGQPLLGHFPEYPGGVPILWMPKDVDISVLVVESSMFALGCSDGRLMIGHIPPS